MGACQRCRWGTCASLVDYDNHIRADERAKIVADLRREADALDAAYDELRISRAPGSAMQSVFDKAEMCRSLASRIERNEHRKGGEECPGCGGTFLGLKDGRCRGCNEHRKGGG